MPYKDLELRKEKQKLYNRTHYDKNKKECIKRAADIKKEARRWWATFKASLSCQNCGFSHPVALDFHHLESHPDNQKLNVLVGNGMIKAALEEIKKCAVLCANCHRRLHNDPKFEKEVVKKITRMTSQKSLRTS
jgi:hypothetical protein